jgi:hypothetical protein
MLAKSMLIQPHAFSACVKHSLTMLAWLCPWGHLQIGGADDQNLVFAQRAGQGIKWLNRCGTHLSDLEWLLSS